MKKAISVLICVMLLAGVLAGCGGGAKSAGNESSSQAASTAPAAEKKTEEPKKEPVTLKFLLNSPELTEQYNDMAKEYNKQFPNVTLDMNVLQNDYITVLKARLNSGDIPDMFMSSAYNENKVYKDYIYDLTNEDFMKQIEPSALNGVTMDGKITGYPFLLQAHSFIYNKKVFADAGITELPRTMKELEEVCKKLQGKGIQPFGTGFKEWWVLEQTSTQYLAPVRDSYGGDYTKLIDELNSGSKKFGDIKEIDNVFNIIDLQKKYGGTKPMETDFNMQCTLLATGKAAMIHQGTWAEDTIKKTNPDADIGFLAAPVDDNPDKAGIMVDSNLTFRVAKDNKNLNETLNWLRWLTTSDYGKAWVPEKIKQMSTIKGAPLPKAQLAEDTVKFMNENKTYPWFKGYYVDGFEQPVGVGFQSYAAGKTREQVKEELSKAYEKAAKAAQ